MLPNEALIFISFLSSSQSTVIECSNLIIGCENYQIVLNSEIYIFSTQFRRAIGESSFKLAVETITVYAITTRSKDILPYLI